MSEHFISHETAEGDLLYCATYIAEAVNLGEGHSQAIETVVSRHLAKNDVDLAAELANTIDDSFVRGRLLSSVAERCAEIGDVDYALQLADVIEDPILNCGARTKVGLLLAAHGKFDDAKDVAAELEYADPVYAAIAVQQSIDGNDAGAVDSLQKIDAPDNRTFALLSIAGAQIENKNIENAINSLESAAIAADEIDHIDGQSRALYEIGLMYLDADQREKAIETFVDLRDRVEVEEFGNREKFLTNIAVGFWCAGDAEACESTLNHVSDKTHKSEALLEIAWELWNDNERPLAIETLDESYEMLKSQTESETRHRISRNALYRSISETFGEFDMGERAIQIAGEIPDPLEQIAALSRIAQSMTSQKKFSVQQEALSAILDRPSRITALIGVSDVQIREDNTSGAIETLNNVAVEIEDVEQPSIQARAYGDIAWRFANLGSLEKFRFFGLKSLGKITEITDETTQVDNLAHLSDIYASGDYAVSDAENAVLKTLVRGNI